MLKTDVAKELVSTFHQKTMEEITLELQKRAVWLRQIAEEGPRMKDDPTYRRCMEDAQLMQDAADALTKVFAK